MIRKSGYRFSLATNAKRLRGDHAQTKRWSGMTIRRNVITLRVRASPWGEILMSVQMVLLPVFVLIGLTFALLLGMVSTRTRALTSREISLKDIALGQPNWPERATQIGNCFSNQFELPLVFYVLIALALPLRHADLVIVLLSWVFVLTRFIHAGIFVTSNDVRPRSLAWFAGVIVLLIMWVWFAIGVLFSV